MHTPTHYETHTFTDTHTTKPTNTLSLSHAHTHFKTHTYTHAVIEKFNPGKAPGEDGQNSEIFLKTFKRFPTFIIGLYNECLRKGYFPKQWKHSIIIPIIKPGK